MNTDVSESQVDYRVRRGAISAYGRALRSSQRLWWAVCFFTVVTIVLLAFLLLFLPEESPLALKTGLSTAILLVGVGFSVIWNVTQKQLIEPDLAIRKWLQQVCDGDLEARIDLPDSHPHHKELNFHTRNLASTLMQLSTEMESVVESQTHSLEQQKQVRNLLFQLAADVTRESERESVIKAVCHRLALWCGHANIYGYLIKDKKLTCITAVSSDSSHRESVRKVEITPQMSDLNLAQAIEISSNPSSSHNTQIRIPFDEGNAVVGMLFIECDALDPLRTEETERVLNTVREQLSLFMTKQVAVDQAQSAQLIRERTAMAAEIHDSLAQTLLASRYQVSLLRESMEDKQATEWSHEVKTLEDTIFVANSQVRDLLHEYRTPMTKLTSIDALGNVIDEFRESSGMEVFFQCDNRLIQFNSDEETVLKQIVSESLINAQKYSKAEVIRVYVQDDRNGIRSLLIEDDGVGFDTAAVSEASTEVELNGDEHFGMSIMQERALSIGAVLNIESEPGDGTRLSLKLPPRLAG